MTTVAYVVTITDRAAKELSKHVAHQDKERVKAKILELGADPRPHGCRKVRGVLPTLYRVRIGDYGVFYRVRDEEHAVVVATAGRRREDTSQNL